MTECHLPRSTFMLVAAFAGTNRMKNAYAHAIATGYRFYPTVTPAFFTLPIAMPDFDTPFRIPAVAPAVAS